MGREVRFGGMGVLRVVVDCGAVGAGGANALIAIDEKGRVEIQR